MALSFFKAAELLPDDEELRWPLVALYAHSAELALKSVILAAGQGKEWKGAAGHDLNQLFSDALGCGLQTAQGDVVAALHAFHFQAGQSPKYRTRYPAGGAQAIGLPTRQSYLVMRPGGNRQP
jgi:hypothetical protein